MASRLLRYLLPVGVPGGLGFLLILTSGSFLIAKKIVAFLILPCGLIWMGILAAALWPGVERRWRAMLLGIWILYTVAGSPYVGVGLLRTLEKPLYEYEVLVEPLDAIVLLGGGTVQSPGGNPALGNHGDRILRPAMYYHQGKARVLITTGRSITEKGADRLLSKETSELWQSLGIPESAIIELSKPRNTSEELKAVAELWKSHPEWTKVGLSSSASHLPRAFKQAEKQGLEMVPVPSDFRSMPLVFNPMYLVPQGRGFRDVQSALWEYLGRLL